MQPSPLVSSQPVSFGAHRRWACAVFVLSIVSVVSAYAQQFTTVASFDGGNGHGPRATLVQGTDGNLYGVTAAGGAPCMAQGTFGCGTVFKITTGGSITTLYSFCTSSGCPDGWEPLPGLVLAANGKFYGVTYIGGSETGGCEPHGGCGTIFEITSGGALTTVHRFASIDGLAPQARLVQARNGNFYAPTFFGGINGLGTIFQLTQRGALTSLYSFCSQTNCTDGALPNGALAEAADHSFYGVTVIDGVNTSKCPGNIPAPCGTIFRIQPGGTTRTLYSFCSQPNCVDGTQPNGSLVLLSDGDFYGSTFSGGNRRGTCEDCYFGTIFKITPAGTLTTLYRFCARDGCPDGQNPTAGLVLATDGNLYGVTVNGGSGSNCSASIFPNGCGTIFKITPTGKLTTLYSFCRQANCADGLNPGGLFQATDGNFYGTTIQGGDNDDGTVFQLSVGLSPFVMTVPLSGQPGMRISILGTDLSSATKVTFNGTTAAFTVSSKTQILARVPTGATTGKVRVTTPHGTLTSNVDFRVEPLIEELSGNGGSW
jgi:uncharacterized repeat protein (TIGR03803 family)